MRKLMLAYTYETQEARLLARIFLDTDEPITETNIQRWEETIAYRQDLGPDNVMIFAVTVVECEGCNP